MITILLTILKTIGIILLALLGIAVLLILCALFVPVRYKIVLHRKTGENTPVKAIIRLSWLVHIVNVAFSYPEAAYLRIRVFFFTVYRSDKQDEQKMKKAEEIASQNIQSKTMDNNKEELSKEDINKKDINKEDIDKEDTHRKDIKKKKKRRKEDTLWGFCKKLWDALKNIQYTIIKICDKIKHIVKNTQYYIKILQSEIFRRTWTLCSEQVFALLKMLRPRKMKGSILAGTGDPASTGQILAFFGIIYPFLDADIILTPDFEQVIFEGDLEAKGRITLFRLLKIAITVYFNKDLRRMMKLLKREAA